jgi:hypothetical protein
MRVKKFSNSTHKYLTSSLTASKGDSRSTDKAKHCLVARTNFGALSCSKLPATR